VLECNGVSTDRPTIAKKGLADEHKGRCFVRDNDSQLYLLTRRRFLPLFITQFLGAFNDNLFKNLLLVLLVSAGTAGSLDSDLMINLAAGLFVLPFFLLSPLAGQLADKYEKATLIRRVKIAEIVVISLRVLSLILQS